MSLLAEKAPGCPVALGQGPWAAGGDDLARQRPPDLRIDVGAVLRGVGLSGWTSSNFGRWMFEDYPRAVLATPSRWGRRLLRPPGAYRGGFS